VKVVLLTQNPKNYSARRLREASEARGHKVRALDPLRLSMDVEAGRPTLVYKGKALERPAAVIPRVGTSITFFGTAVLRQLEQMGAFCLNSSSPSRSRATSSARSRSSRGTGSGSPRPASCATRPGSSRRSSGSGGRP